MATNADTLVPAASPKRHALSLRCRVGVALVALLLSIIGSAAIILVADHFLFKHGTWSGWTLTPYPPKRDDLQWWQSRVGPLPPPTNTGDLISPQNIRGRDGRGGQAAETPTNMRLPHGFVAYRMDTRSPVIRGRVLVGVSRHIWYAGVEFPGGMVVERQCRPVPGQPPLHPTIGGWHSTILPAGLALNTLYGAAPLCIIVTLVAWPLAARYRKIRRGIRLAYGRCPECSHPLLPEQEVCPECGCPRPRPVANTSQTP